jgi:hypothetical protein
MKKQLVILVISLTVVFLLANYSKDIFKTGYSIDIGKNGSSTDVLSNFSTVQTTGSYIEVSRIINIPKPSPDVLSNFSTGVLSNFSIPTPIFTSDNSNIPIVDYGSVDGFYIGPQRNPLTISRAVIEHYNSYKQNGGEKSKQSLINNANWLADNAISRGNYSTLEYKFPWPPYDLQPPWRSGMTQGEAIRALINAHEITGDKKYLDLAKLLLNSFFVEVKDGGVTYKTPKDGWWYEEYASVGGVESRVLNGMMFAVLGIYEYYKYTNDGDAKYLFDQGVLALKKNIAHYDYKDGYSYYDIVGNLSPLQYHNVLIELSDRLYDITKEETFKLHYDRWKNFKIPDPHTYHSLSIQSEFQVF